MRFVAKYPRLSLGTVIKEKFVLAVDGQRDQVADSVSVTFSQEELTQADIDYALTVWKESAFTGRWLEEDGVNLEQVDGRISVFDTTLHGWDDELREKVEKWMLAKPNYGDDFTLVQAAVQAGPTKPWASYDETHHFKVPTLAVELGLVAETLAYEQATKNRPGVVEALEEKQAAIVAADAAAEVVAA